MSSTSFDCAWVMAAEQQAIRRTPIDANFTAPSLYRRDSVGGYWPLVAPYNDESAAPLVPHNAQLTGRRRAQRGGDPTATPLGARVERRVGL